MTFRLDYSNMMISPGGIDQKTWSDAPRRFPDAKRGFDALRGAGAVGFVNLPRATQLLDQVTSFARLARGKHDDVVILGSRWIRPGADCLASRAQAERLEHAGRQGA